MTGITPPPIFQKTCSAKNKREAEDRFYQDNSHDFAIRLEQVIGKIRRLGNRLRRRPNGPGASASSDCPPIDKPETAAFKIGLRSMEPEPHVRTDARCHS